MLKRSTFMAALVGAALFSSSLVAGEVTKADRDTLVAHLKKTQDAFLKSIDGLSEAQWKWKAAPERWSAAETAEHITTSEGFLRGMVAEMMKTPASPELLAKTKGKEQVVLTVIPDRTKKAQAPEPLLPKNAYATRQALTDAFKKSRAETLALAGGSSDLRAYAREGLPVGEVDAYQAVLFLSAHTERHTKQIEEVKATAGFPK